ncbi:MAG: sigma-54-dependent Fis family transcriptional regulator [Rhodospirillaceae bacterium]|nr:sigma-54-dependent Fis family transcriptional regulator [Rhodospirillaceae bacterium]
MAQDILIVDDEADIRMLISGILQDEGYTTREAGGGDQALALLKAKAPAAVILDIWLEGSKLDGLQVLSAIKNMRPSVPVIMISGHGTIETAVKAIKQGAYDFIEKPFQADRLLLILERAIEAARLKRENLELKSRAGDPEKLIGNCVSVSNLRRVVERVGPTGSRVLITGPAGSGKEVVARQIHMCSPRANGPFVVVNCASLHPDRLQELLFGTAGAKDQRALGLLELADGGTLLLDEVADMPLETQGRIIRVLQDQNIDRANGMGHVELDVRFIATTNRDLKAEIRNGLFREELYYRLSVVPIQVPPLAERREDIPELARYLLDRGAATSGLPRRALGEDAIAALQTYQWPGNVRQLRNVIDWLLIMAPGSVNDQIRADMLPPDIGSDAPQMLKLQRSDEIMTLPLRDAREMFEREYLVAQVIRYGGNISRTAEFVGMERSALHRKLKSLGVGGDMRQSREGSTSKVMPLGRVSVRSD